MPSGGACRASFRRSLVRSSRTARIASSRQPALHGPAYCDASALATLYLQEPESDALNREVKGRRDLIASDLGVTEVVSSIARRRREGHVSAEAAARLHRALLGDLEGGVFQRMELTPEVHREAERLLLASSLPLRAADALHLALAVGGRAATVITFDLRLAAAATVLGLRVHPAAPG